MSEAKHTPEPWRWESEDDLSLSICGEHFHIGTVIPDIDENGAIDDEQVANAARIVACVNACEGVADPQPGAMKALVEACGTALDAMAGGGSPGTELRLERALSLAKGGAE